MGAASGLAERAQQIHSQDSPPEIAPIDWAVENSSVEFLQLRKGEHPGQQSVGDIAVLEFNLRRLSA
jgi:hypothetical protein